MMRIQLAALAVGLMALQAVAFEQRRTVRIVAERFSFTPSRIEIDAGETVELLVRSDDTSHGLRISGTGIDTATPKRGSGSVSVIVRIDEPGRYTFECSRMCGAGHTFMRGELIVRAPRESATNP